jgi:Polyphosphate kinase N-terminal domain
MDAPFSMVSAVRASRGRLLLPIGLGPEPIVAPSRWQQGTERHVHPDEITRVDRPPETAEFGIDSEAAAAPTKPRRDARFVNRELARLDYDERVLALAEDEGRLVLERARFLAIFSRNAVLFRWKSGLRGARLSADGWLGLPGEAESSM